MGEETMIRFPMIPLVAFVGLSACNQKDDGLVPGQCGLEGTRVECVDDSDCPEFIDYNPTHCNLTGHCAPGSSRQCWPPEDYVCRPEMVCGYQGRCTYTCDTHEDCPTGEYCMCWDGVFKHCFYSRCDEGACADGMEPEEGTLRCVPSVLEGECWSLSPDEPYPDGYDKVGLQGCIRAR